MGVSGGRIWFIGQRWGNSGDRMGYSVKSVVLVVVVYVIACAFVVFLVWLAIRGIGG